MISGIIGVRYARGCHPDDLWTTYFTSSKYVQEYRKKHGEPDVIEVRQTFNDSLQAREWEERVIDRVDAVKSTRWLNRQNAGKEFIGGTRSEEHKKKLSLIMIERAKNGVNPNKTPEGRKRCKENAQKRVENGTHNFQGEKGSIQSKQLNQMMIDNGIHPFVGNKNPNKTPEGRKRCKENASKNAKQRVENGTHNFQGGKSLCVFDIETKRSLRISRELYNETSGRYFNNNSKIAKLYRIKENG